MPKLAVRLAVSMAIAVVAMTGLEALRLGHPLSGRPTAPAAAVPTEVDTAGPRLGVASALAAEPPSPAARRRDPLAMARIHGRVVGSGSAADDLTVEVVDSTRVYRPRIGDQGGFEINLPAGSYTVEASAGKEVAVAEVPDLLVDEDREVLLRLVPGAAIAGRVDGCDGPCSAVTLKAQVPGSGREETTTDSDENGEFVLAGLFPGRAYDLVVEAVEKRTLSVHGISAPRQGVVVTLEPARSLVGGFGMAPGQPCPMEWVTLETPRDNGSIEHSQFDRACRFRFDNLPEVESVHITAEGDGWHFDVEVALPARGDPPFLCLHPTCRDPEPEPSAKLLIGMQGTAERSAYATLLYPDGETAGRGCTVSATECVLDDLHPGLAVSVVIHADGCESRTFTVDLHPGANHVGFQCETVRPIQGVVRGKLHGALAMVRCSSQHPERPASGRVFRLQCPARLRTIEYRLGAEASWQSAPIATDEGDDDHEGFVQIAAD